MSVTTDENLILSFNPMDDLPFNLLPLPIILRRASQITDAI